MSAFSANGIVPSGKEEMPLYAGEFHYWRAEPRDWKDGLNQLVDLGLTAVSTQVPWSVHERSSGQFVFDREKHLGQFLDTARDVGLHALVRIGPAQNAQLTGFGFPQRLLEMAEIHALGPDNRARWLPVPPKMIPIPSYASRVFQDEVSRWFSAVAEVLVPRLDPSGPVIAIGLDNQLPLFWRQGSLEADYHPDALAWWHEAAGDLPAPRDHSESLQTLLRWIQFKEEYLERSISWLKAAADSAGFSSVPYFHNLPPQHPTRAHLPQAESAIGDGVVGMDFYDLEQGYRRTRHRSLYLSSSSKLPFAPEMAAGGPPWFPAMSESDQKHVLLGALAGGVRAFNLYMAVGRERWYGQGLDSPWLRPLIAGLRELKFHTLRQVRPVALLLSRAESRVALATQAIHSLSPAMSDWLALGPGENAELALDSDARDYPRIVAAIQEALEIGEIPYQLVDEHALHRLAPETKVVILPTSKRVDAGVWGALHALGRTGMQIIVGPKHPTEDEFGEPLDLEIPAHTGVLSMEGISDIEALAGDLSGLVSDLDDLWICPGTSHVHCTAYADQDGHVRGIFVGNAGNADTVAAINAPTGAELRDLISDQHIPECDGVLSVSVSSRQVRLFSVSS